MNEESSVELSKPLQLGEEGVDAIESNKQIEDPPVADITSNYDEEGMLKCPQCNFKTHMPKQFESHLACHTRLRDQMFQCDICHMKFSQKANMNRHRMRHSGFKPYQCGICSKRFFRRDHMRTHEVTHYDSGGRRFECPMCDTLFGRIAVLRHHLDNEHPLSVGAVAQCKVCCVAFTSYARLLTHYQNEHEAPNPRELTESEGGVVVGVENSQVNNYSIALELRNSLAAMVASSLQEDNSNTPLPVLQFNNQNQNCDNEAQMEEHYSYATQNDNNDNSSDSGNKPSFASPNKSEMSVRSPNMEMMSSSESPSLDGRSSANVDNNGQLSCKLCGLDFHDRTLYFLHKGLHAESDPWRCNLCGENCKDKYTFHTHLIGAKHS